MRCLRPRTPPIRNCPRINELGRWYVLVLRYGYTDRSLTKIRQTAYATGLLVARRALTKLGLADKYEGQAEPDGTLQLTEPMEDGPRPFKCFLDVGLKRTSTGARVFGAMKGASDGGIFIPHSEKRFPGYDPEAKELDAETLQNYIYGGKIIDSENDERRNQELTSSAYSGHVAEFMESLEEEDDERFKKHFSSFLAADIGSEDLEDMYKEAHAAIRVSFNRASSIVFR